MRRLEIGIDKEFCDAGRERASVIAGMVRSFSQGSRRGGRLEFCVQRRIVGLGGGEDRHQVAERHAVGIELVGRRGCARVESRTLDFCRREKLRGERFLWELLQRSTGSRPD